MKITLDKPLKLDDKTIKEIDLNLENLTGAAILQVDMELRMEGQPDGLKSVYNQDVLLKIASKASGILEDDLQKLSLPDFLEVTFNTRSFLLGLSGNQEEQESSEKSSSTSDQQVETE